MKIIKEQGFTTSLLAKQIQTNCNRIIKTIVRTSLVWGTFRKKISYHFSNFIFLELFFLIIVQIYKHINGLDINVIDYYLILKYFILWVYVYNSILLHLNPRLWHNWLRNRPALGRLWVQFSSQTASQLNTLKVVPSAAMSDTRH